MTKKILFICPSSGKFSNMPCGRDSYKLAKYLADNFDVSVEILSSIKADEEYEKNLKVIYIPTYRALFQKSYKKYNSLNGVIKFFYRFKLRHNKKIFKKKSFANYVMSFSDFKKWVKTYKRTKYDLMVSISHPFYVHEYAKFLINNIKIDKWCAWFLDPYADNYNLSDSRNEIKKRIIEENSIFKNCTSIFATYEMVNKYKNSQIVNYLDKVTIAPVHLITDNCSITPQEISKDKEVKCVFTGAFLASLRNPKVLLDCFIKLPSNCFLYLYSRGCDDIINQYRDVLGERLVTHDYILNKVEFDKMINSMDILIDIGNAVDNMVPSKVLNYISYGKPILHFSNCVNDPVERILEKYKLSLSLPYNESIDVDKIVKFCSEMKGKKILWEEIEILFYHYTLQYIADKLLKMLE